MTIRPMKRNLSFTLAGVLALATAVALAMPPLTSQSAEPVAASQSQDSYPVSEPGTLALLGIGIAGVAARMRRKSG